MLTMPEGLVMTFLPNELVAKLGEDECWRGYGSEMDTLGEDVVTELKRISKPGRRVYSGQSDLPSPLDGLGVAIISTSRGVLSDKQCREQNVGGEILCTVY